MISMHQIGSSGDAANYYDKAFKQDGVSHADNYYAGEQASALWEGKGAEVLGLKGQAVKREDFVAFLEGRLKNPATGEIQDLSKNTRGDRRLGYDFTVSPPKSVSIVGLVGNDKQVVDAHLAANERAMAWLEKNASVIRVKDGNDGLSAKQAGNLLYATVLHETNRNNEPQIHSHNVIVSAVYDDK
jgi:conjugative relaxase-like TrwC/TraI family protein